MPQQTKAWGAGFQLRAWPARDWRRRNYFVRRVLTNLFNRSGQKDTSAGLDRLTRLVRRFTVDRQQVPRDLDELVTLKYLDAVPTAPFGKRFVIDRRKVEVRLELAATGSQAGTVPTSPKLPPSLASSPGEVST